MRKYEVAGLTGVKAGVRKVRKSSEISSRVRTSDPILMKKQEVTNRVYAAFRSLANDAMKEIEPPKAQQQMPRLPPE